MSEQKNDDLDPGILETIRDQAAQRNRQIDPNGCVELTRTMMGWSFIIFTGVATFLFIRDNGNSDRVLGGVSAFISVFSFGAALSSHLVLNGTSFTRCFGSIWRWLHRNIEPAVVDVQQEQEQNFRV
jgi:hypothetical protein